MTTLSISDFKPLDQQFPNFYFHRTNNRTSSTLYLARHQSQTLLIDSGDGKDALDFVPDACFLTHGHFDHTRGVKKEWSDAFIHPAEDASLPYIEIPPNAAQLPSHEFEFGPYLFEILHTPGHTPGSICLFEPNLGLLFSGDTLFADGVPGRTDLGGSDEQMVQSHELLATLGWKLLGPGHGPLQWADGKKF